MGIVRKRTKNALLKQAILVEVVSRIIKSELREIFRQTMNLTGLPTQEPFVKAVIEHFNLLLGKKNKESYYYWNNMKIRIETKFSGALTSYEFSENYRIEEYIVKKKIYF